MESNIIKSDLEKLLDNLKKSSTQINSSDVIKFDFNNMFKELESIIVDYKKENLKKSIGSEKELSKNILTN